MSKPNAQCRRLSADPLIALGPSLFLSILADLPFPSLLNAERVSRKWRTVFRAHENGIWRAACHRTGVESKHMAQLEAFERAAASSFGWHSDPEESEYEPQGNTVGWRKICKAFVELDRNWRLGRCSETWTGPSDTLLWRIKVDPESNTLIYSSRFGGLYVSDLETNHALFRLGGLRHHSHVEFAQGFVVFDVDEGLQVYRTQSAIGRSSVPTPPANRRPPLANTAISMSRPGFNPRTHTGPLPKGHLAYYRTINPPTPCRAFRARVDHEGQLGKARAVLGTAGQEAAYIWDLDEEGKVETIEFGRTIDIGYIEFDEEFIFICSDRMHIYSRKTREELLSFPPSSDVSDCAALGFSVNWVQQVPVERTTRCPAGAITPSVYSVDTRGVYSPTNASTDDVRDDDVAHYDFKACHYSRDDLIGVSGSGFFLVVQDYRQIFHAATLDERRRLLEQRAFWIRVDNTLHSLAVHGSKVTCVGLNKMIFFDTARLPRYPFENDETLPTLRLMDRNKIYMAYTGTEGMLQRSVLKVWDFTPVV